MGSSQNGLRSLETRVHGLELALDEISFDLAVSNRRMSSTEATCCMIPGADFLSSKFRKKTEGRGSTSRFSPSNGTPPGAAMRYKAAGTGRNDNAGTFRSEHRIFRLQGGGEFVVNPLAEIPSDSREISEASSNRISRNAHKTAQPMTETLQNMYNHAGAGFS